MVVPSLVVFQPTSDLIRLPSAFVIEDVGEGAEGIHAKAAHLLRLLVAEHPFVDGNKRTALNTVVVFYDVNGYEFDYEDESVRTILKRFATDEGSVDVDRVISYCSTHAQPADE